MLDSQNLSNATYEQAHERTTQLLLLGLLFVRMLLGVGLMPAFSEPVWRGGLILGYDVLTYLLTACLIWWERARLPEFRIGKLALILFVAGVPYKLLIAWWTY